MAERRTETASLGPVVGYVQWGPIVAGALVAAAVAFILHAFAGAIGFSVSSFAPTWRDSSLALVLLSALYLLLVALVAYGVGGYVAGRLRTPVTGAGVDEIEFRDGAHGLAVWALATLMTALLAFGTAQSLTQFSAPSGGEAGPATSIAGENIIAYDLDRLFRTDQGRTEDFEYARAEAARILLMASSHRGLTEDDRRHLQGLVSRHTGLADQGVQGRVLDAIASATENISRARRTSVILAFVAGTAALLGAVVAWFGAVTGGQHRDFTPISMTWTWRGPARDRAKAQ